MKELKTAMILFLLMVVSLVGWDRGCSCEDEVRERGPCWHDAQLVVEDGVPICRCEGAQSP